MFPFSAGAAAARGWSGAVYAKFYAVDMRLFACVLTKGGIIEHFFTKKRVRGVRAAPQASTTPTS